MSFLSVRARDRQFCVGVLTEQSSRSSPLRQKMNIVCVERLHNTLDRALNVTPKRFLYSSTHLHVLEMVSPLQQEGGLAKYWCSDSRAAGLLLLLRQKD